MPLNNVAEKTPRQDMGRVAQMPKTIRSKIRARSIGKTFGEGDHAFVALEDFNLDIADGEFVSIVGPSGCGKSTFLRILAGLETQSVGEIEIVREDSAKALLNVVFQEQSAFPWLTVRDNVSYGLRMRGLPKKTIKAVVDDWIAKVGLKAFADAYPHQLSGGMKQRVSIARAWANDPEILLMDEPFAALDALTKTVLQDELLELWEANRRTVVYVTHSLDEAVTLSDRIVVMSSRPGRIREVFDVPFERQRDAHAIKKDPRYGELIEAIWSILHDEVVSKAK